jgi:hypothetical protein
MFLTKNTCGSISGAICGFCGKYKNEAKLLYLIDIKTKINFLVDFFK